ncbi:MAG: ATP-binding response regulator [Nitrospiraceae bacterium]
MARAEVGKATQMTVDDKVSILLVDDRKESLMALELILYDLNLDLVKAGSGEEALRWLLKKEFAVILLDVRMPGMDGFETAKLIRQRRNSKHIPIIFVTAFGDNLYEAKGYALGAVDYLPTPVLPDMLRAKVNVFIELFKKTTQLERQGEALAERAKQLHALTQVSLEVSSATTLKQLRKILDDSMCVLLRTNQGMAIFDVSPLLGAKDKTPVSMKPEERLLQDVLHRTSRPVRLTHHQLTTQTAWKDAARTFGHGLLAAPLIDRSGRNIGFLYVSDKQSGDMTEQDEAIFTQLANITSVAIENQVSVEAREANRLKDEFLSVLSHELRSPLNAILGWIRLLRSEKIPPEESVRALEIIERNTHAQTRLIEDLLDVSRIASGKLALNVREVHLISIIQAALDSVRPQAESKGIVLHAALPEEIGMVKGDPDRLQQVVTNLLHNAFKFTSPGGRVDVVLKQVENGLRLQIADTGKGIKPEFLPLIFERFRQGDSSSTRSEGGLGIGLTVVRHIVESHGGIVRGESEGEGKGATFTVELPLESSRPRKATTRPDTKDAIGRPVTPGRSAWVRDLSGVRVLVVDDDQDGRDVIVEILARCGALVSAVGSTREALEAMCRHHPQILISDISMPGADGYDLIRAIRQLGPEEGGNVPAVAFTAYASSDEQARLLAAGFQLHVSKPCDPTKLPRLLTDLLGHSPTFAGPQIRPTGADDHRIADVPTS